MWYLDNFEYVKFDGDAHFFLFRPFFELSKKFIWHFNVT